MQISLNSVVYFHYSLLNEKGGVIETSKGEDPVIFIQGKGQIVKGLEAAMLGKSEGSQFQTKIKADQGYGEWDEDKVFDISIDDIADVESLEVGMLCQVTTPEDEQALVEVIQLTDTLVTVDSNHPYAGEDLKFSIEVIKVRKATEDELASGKASE